METVSKQKTRKQERLTIRKLLDESGVPSPIAHAIHGVNLPPRLVHLARMADHWKLEVADPRRMNEQTRARTLLKDSERQLRHCLWEAVERRDANALRELAKHFERRPSKINLADPVRFVLLQLKALAESRPSQDGSTWVFPPATIVSEWCGLSKEDPSSVRRVSRAMNELKMQRMTLREYTDIRAKKPQTNKV